MSKKKVFISGPMSGYENYNREAFNKAEKELIEAGYSVFNPAWLLFDESWSHYDIMPIDLAALERCDYIYQLEGWEDSKGAMEEWSFARLHNISILYRHHYTRYLGYNKEEPVIEYSEYDCSKFFK